MASSLRVPIPKADPPEWETSFSPASLIVRLVLAMVVLALLIGGVQLFWARHHLTSGAAELNTAFNTIRSPAALSKAASRDAAITALAHARNEFSSAHGDLDFWAPILSTMGWVPHYGRQITAAPSVASAALFTTSSAYDIVRGLRDVWPLLSDQRRRHGLLKEIGSTVAANEGAFVNATEEAVSAGTVTKSLPSRTGNSQLDNAISKLKQALPRLRAAGLWLAVSPSLLGEEGTQKYLFAWENADEIRATGGFIGAADLITMRKGVLAKQFSGSELTGEALHSPVTPPIPESVTTREGSWLFRDSNFSPDFPTSARLERWFYDRDTKRHVSGVIDFVDQGIPYVLNATGPVYMPQYHVTVNSRNAEALANRYATANSVPSGYRGPHKYRNGENLDTYRKQFLGFEVAAILKRLQSLPADRWGILGTSLSIAIRRHDIMLWSKNPSIERAIDASGAGGQLKAKPGDFLYVVDDNRSYNKIGPYVREWATYSVQVLPTYWLSSSLTIHYHLLPSPPNLEGQGPQFSSLPGYNKHQLRDFLRVYVPAGAAGVVQNGLRLITQNLAQRAYGLTQVSGWFDISPRQTKTITITYQTPANALAFDKYKRYQLTMLRQPGTRLKGLTVRVQGLSGIGLGPRSEPALKRWVPLTGTRSLLFPVHTANRHEDQPVLIPVSTKKTLDPWIPWKALSGFGKR